MTHSEMEYQKFLDGCKPFTKAYCDWWSDVLQSYGFTHNTQDSYYWYKSFQWNGRDYTLSIHPMSYKGVWFSGMDNNGKTFRKKCITENGLRKYLKENKLGVFFK